MKPESSRFFNVAMKPIMLNLKSEILKEQDDLGSYEDNLYVISDDPTLMDPIQHYFEGQKTNTGFELRVEKCSVVDFFKVKQGETCIDTLGACIGTKAQRIAFLEAKINEL